MSKCSQCGYELRAGQTVCPACRKPVYREESESATQTQSKRDFVIKTPSIFMKYADLLDDDQLYKLAVCKLNGISVEKNEEEAIEIFKLLAFRGHHESMYKLAEYLLDTDRDTACKWLRIAASEGHKPSKLKLEFLGDNASTSGRRIENKFSGLEGLVRDALPSIVSIEVGSEEKGKKVISAGSGFIIEGGFVITNAHVIGENPLYIVACFESELDKVIYNLLPIAVIPAFDIAILRFTGLADKKFTSRKNLNLRLNDIEYGEEVYTIGNPLGIGLSVTKGIVSCPNRASKYPPAVDEVIQTDMTINHGNSGGALLDMENNVIGMMTFSLSASEGGMAMSVPATYIVAVLNKILK